MEEFLAEVDDLLHVHHLLQLQTKEELEYACLCNLDGDVVLDQRVFLQLLRERAALPLPGRPPAHFTPPPKDPAGADPSRDDEESSGGKGEKRTAVASRKRLFSFRNRKDLPSTARVTDKDSVGGKGLTCQDLLVLILPAFAAKVDLANTPALPLARWRLSRALATLSGPGDSSCGALTYHTLASAWAVSHYPLVKQRPFREGDPICDRFLVRLYADRAFLALADGCNWGHMARKAAKRATKKLLETVEQYAPSIRDTRLAAAALLLGFSRAHERILEFDQEEIGPAPGKSTLVGGLLVRRPSSESGEGEYALVYVSLGDCKLLHYAPGMGRVTDITYGNRTNLLNARDAGGRLGGSADHVDIRNLTCGVLPVQAGDYVLAISDGIHDNLDPRTLGVSPHVLGLEAPTWEEVEPSTALRVRTEYMERRMLALFQMQGKAPSPQALVQALIRVSGEITEPSRQFMEAHPSQKLPPDTARYPGKLDHASCVCLRATCGEDEEEAPRTSDYLGNAFHDTHSAAAHRHALLRERQLSYASDLFDPPS